MFEQTNYILKDVVKLQNGIKGNLVLPTNHIDPLPNFGPDLKELLLIVEYQAPHRLRISICENAEKSAKRWRVPESFIKINEWENSESQPAQNEYEFGYVSNPFSFYVKRKSDGQTIFDTTGQKLVFKDQYIEISTLLPAQSNIYGFGEVVAPLKRKEGQRMTLWNRDAPCPEGENLYGSHPFYIEINEGKAHGVFLLNSNGMDVCYENGKLTYKIIGGIIDFYILLGPKPQAVVEQYAQMIGYPYFIPYWSLGFHQCRWGYNTLEQWEKMVSQQEDAKLPMDVAWIDIDYMDSFKIFTYSQTRFPPKKLADFITKMHQKHQKVVLIVDPGIKVENGYSVYDDGVEKGLLIKRADGENFVGRVWPGLTVFPDWFHPNIQEYWTEHIARWIKEVPIDGIWLDMNEIANFVNGDVTDNISNNNSNYPNYNPFPDKKIEGFIDTGIASNQSMGRRVQEIIYKVFTRLLCNTTKNKVHQSTTTNTKKSKELASLSVNNPPYAINNFGNELPLCTRTSPMDAFHHSGIIEYDAHNLFGLMQSMVTNRALQSIQPEKRPFILSRSTFPSTGKYAAHWLGDNNSSWKSLIDSISGILAFQFFAIPLVGADICGFYGTCEEELAIRWAQLGSFYPFCRNHNAINLPSQEFYHWEKVAHVAKYWLEIRYKLLPYWYTGFFKAAIHGTPVISPLWFLEPEVSDTYSIDQQFLVGKGLLVTPVTQEGAIKVRGYFPGGIWYDFLSGAKLLDEDKGQWKVVDAPLEVIPVHIQGGLIIPMHCKARLTTFETRNGGLHFLIALDREGVANGELYLDDGETLHEKVNEKYTLINLSVYNSSLTVDGVFQYDGPGSYLDEIVIYGADRCGDIVYRDANTGESKLIEKEFVEWREELGILSIRELGISLYNNHGFTLSWI
ncbi:hypothetical protein G9A89_015885 [Geosiphon pyriformis]|nr:hypothetical protein G9A89_015885 [Geosiphon pyriformis]